MLKRWQVSALIFTLCCTSLSAAPGSARQNGPQTSPASVSLMPLAEVRTGMKGAIRTVFQGSAIEEFGFEVLGVMKNVLGPKQDIILVQLKGQKPEFTGVVAGMSGSPAYIDGRLVGALSLRFGSFAKEPVAGVTPIESMLSVFKAGAGPRPSTGRTAVVPDAGPSDLGGGEMQPTRASDPSDSSHLLSPIPTPLFMTGFREEVVDRFAPVFRQHNLVPSLGGSRSAAAAEFRPAAAADFVPGAPVSGVLVSGDLGIYATGTLSYRDGDRVLAFGHPLLQIGSTEMPMARATILKTLASVAGSFKIAELDEIIGTFRQDRLTAIQGIIGAKPRTIPVRVSVESALRGTLPYRYEIFQHPALTPMLFNITLYESILGSLEQSDEMTIELSGKINVENQPEIRIHDRFTSSDSSYFLPVPYMAAMQIGNYFSRLYGNGYEVPRIVGTEFAFHVSEERRTATIEDIRCENREVLPGEEATVYVTLRPYRGQLQVRTFKIRIPDHVVRGDTLIAYANDAATQRMRERSFNSTGTGSLRELIEVINRERAGDRLYCQLSQASPGYFIRDRMLPSLPLSVLSVLDLSQGSSELTRVRESPLLLEEQEVNYVVRGSRRLNLTVR